MSMKSGPPSSPERLANSGHESILSVFKDSSARINGLISIYTSIAAHTFLLEAPTSTRAVIPALVGSAVFMLLEEKAD